MGQGELRCGKPETVIDEQVDVDDAVVIVPVHALEGAPHLPLYLLGALEALLRSKGGVHHAGGIEEGIVAAEAPWLGAHEAADTANLPHAPAYEVQCTEQVRLLVSQIGAQCQIQHMGLGRIGAGHHAQSCRMSMASP